MDSARPAPAFSLLETMRLDEGRVVRLERHLARMAQAAADFDYTWQEPRVRAAVARVVEEHPAGRWRLRLLLAGDGSPSIECTPCAPLPTPWRVAFALEPVDPGDPFVLNKTTHRAVYDSARRARPDLDDVLLWNGRGEVTESTIGNIVAEIDGRRWTPPVSSGLLAGTFRGQLIDAGEIAERVLTKADIAGATRLWVINSVREWVEAKLVE
jgi:para-aminobenzoate synthetase/4-amino-4-deoxychorismate lyase